MVEPLTWYSGCMSDSDSESDNFEGPLHWQPAAPSGAAESESDTVTAFEPAWGDSSWILSLPTFRTAGCLLSKPPAGTD
jgi:hypothetical protein